jgi:glycosyltransferase involved in cell wall biosynthesis
VARLFVFGERPWDRYRTGRSLRRLRQAGFEPEPPLPRPLSTLAAGLSSWNGALWLLRAGAWPAAQPALPLPSTTGRPLCALGAVQASAGAGEDAADWARLLARTGGELGKELPREIHSLYLEAPLVPRLAALLGEGRPLRESLAAVLRDARSRVVRHGGLDVEWDPALRVAQVVTSLQQGGAERVALDLSLELPRAGVRTLLVSLGAPTRSAFAAPAGTLELAWEQREDRGERASRMAEELIRRGTDLVHGHLLEGDDVRRLAAAGLPPLLTIHNVRAGWAAGTETLRPGDSALLVGCAQEVDRELRGAGLGNPVRTVWNGIDAQAVEPTAGRQAAGRAWRARWGFGAGDFVLLALANPRPQKRLERLPPILGALRGRLRAAGSPREARLVLAGAASWASEAAAEADRSVDLAVEQLGLAAHVRRAGSVADIGALLAACDVLVATSAHEGLSLAQLEALAAGLPVVATGVGGTVELARLQPTLFALAADAPPEAFAEALAPAALAPPAPRRSALAPHFSRGRMAASYARLYPSAVAAAARRGQRRAGVLLVTNNFSVGGAQSSARRLLLGLAARGVPVRAAVLEEQPEHPTPGRRALLAAGVPVLALPPPAELDPAQATARLLEAIDGEPPAAVLFWNVIAEHKILLADGLLDVPVFDVSPGEMYFTSLERYLERPRPGLPYLTAADYGARLAGVVVKYRAEAGRAEAVLGVRAHVIPNGVGLRAATAQPRQPSQPLVIGTLARIAAHKRLEQLLDALRRANGRLPPHVLRIAGGVEPGAAAYAVALRDHARGLPVEWVGELDDPGPFLGGLDLFALIAEPAGCPNASLEAMAAALPVVATDVGGAREQIEDGVSGRLVPAGDTEGLAAALVELAHDATGRSRLAAAGRRRVEALFDEQRMITDYQQLCALGL